MIFTDVILPVCRTYGAQEYRAYITQPLSEWANVWRAYGALGRPTSESGRYKCVFR